MALRWISGSTPSVFAQRRRLELYRNPVETLADRAAKVHGDLLGGCLRRHRRAFDPRRRIARVGHGGRRLLEGRVGRLRA